MSNHYDNEIGDDEIRIVSSLSDRFNSCSNNIENKKTSTSLVCQSYRRDNVAKKRGRRIFIIVGSIALIALVVTAISLGLFNGNGDDELLNEGELFIEESVGESAGDESTIVVVVTDSIASEQSDSIIAPELTAKHFTTRKDTLVNNIQLVVLTPHNSTPELQLLDEFRADSTIVLAAQAADIRRDNMEIVGAYVKKGELLSKGDSKSGFCSIINGQLTVGVADASPMLEQALMTDGYFFRQYPLVVGSQLVENKPKGRSIRRALVELNGEFSVVVSQHKVTYGEFSQVLIDLGVRNAIALVGGDAMVAYVEEDGRKFISKDVSKYKYDYINYIVWK